MRGEYLFSYSIYGFGSLGESGSPIEKSDRPSPIASGVKFQRVFGYSEPDPKQPLHPRR